MTRTGFSRTLTFGEFSKVFMNDLKNFRTQPYAVLRLSITASLIFFGACSFKQAVFIKSEFTQETDDERKTRIGRDKATREASRRSLGSDGERDLLDWQERNKTRINSVLNS
jgi:hypothetical protein